MALYLNNMLINEDDLDVIEKLTKLDGQSGSMFIYNDRLKSILLKLNYIQVNAIGWAHGTEVLKHEFPSMKKRF